jgi:hypothetical protein
MIEQDGEKGFKAFEEFKLGPNEFPTIDLLSDPDNEDRLMTKAEEYLDRLKEPGDRDAIIKIRIIEKLLAEKTVDKVSFYSELKKNYEWLDSFIFRNACAVIDSLIKPIG